MKELTSEQWKCSKSRMTWLYGHIKMSELIKTVHLRSVHFTGNYTSIKESSLSLKCVY